MTKAHLEGLVNEHDYWRNQKAILKQDPWSSNQRLDLGQKIFNNPDTLPQGVQRAQSPNALIGENPDTLDSYINAYTRVSYDDVINYVKKEQNLIEILAKTEVEKLVPCAVHLNKEYAGMRSTLENKDGEEMFKYVSKKLFNDRKEIIGAFNYHITKNPNILLKVYSDEIQVKQHEIVMEMSDGMDEEKQPILNNVKTALYITKHLRSASKEMKENAYMNLARAYTGVMHGNQE